MKDLKFLLRRDGDNEATDGTEKKKLNHAVVWLIILAIIFLAGSSIFGGETEREETKSEEKTDADCAASDYVAEMERRLRETLSQIDGAGEVVVMLSMENDGESILATDSRSRSSEQEETAENKSTEVELEKSVVMTGQGTSSQPVIVEEKKPKPAGVLVVASGAQNETVRFEIYEAVKALYGLPAHRIKVTS